MLLLPKEKSEKKVKPFLSLFMGIFRPVKKYKLFVNIVFVLKSFFRLFLALFTEL